MPRPLPIDPHLERIVAAVAARRAAVVVAAPGAGKTTRVPPALLALGPVALLQPRRVAARALARRIAAEQGLTLGEEIGWQVRFQHCASARTRLLVMTEGILTARLQSDPLLTGTSVVVLDEFHERSLHADLALALTRQAMLARDDLHVVVMSATLDPRPIASYLGGAEIVEVPGREHPVAVEHAAMTPAAAIRHVLDSPGGDVLCFLPGVREIRDVAAGLEGIEADVRPLHGSLTADEQDAALAPAGRRKVVLATNVAETSLTVEGVTHVVDAGWAKVLRFDPATGLDRLVLERVPQASAVQRAGRAGRTGPGHALRLWDERLALRPSLEPEMARVDLAAPFLEVLAWGADPLGFDWFEAPPRDAALVALSLLERLGAARHRRITPLGETMRRLPLHPRLARAFVAAAGSERAALACAALSERLPERPRSPVSTESDVLSLVDDARTLPRSIREAGRQLRDLGRRVLAEAAAVDDDAGLRRALLAGFPDRVARRREPGSARVLLASGTGAVLGQESGVREAEWLLALDVQQGPRQGEAIVRVGSAVDKDWLEADATEVVHVFDDVAGCVRASQVQRLGALVLSERAVPPDPIRATDLLMDALARRPPCEEDEAWLRRARFAGVDVDARALLRDACAGRTTLPDRRVVELVDRATRGLVDRLAPPTLGVPSGRSLPLEYRADGSVALQVKLQEMFGLADTPRVGPRHEPVLLELLSPAGRPVQATRDLRSFWERTYPEVRRELRARYPKHPWPEDPWSATPTHRAKPRGT